MRLIYSIVILSNLLTLLVSHEDKNVIIAVACENQIFIAKCQSSYYTITVIRAIFGRFSLTPCRNDVDKSNILAEDMDTQCSSSNSTLIVQSRCNYHSTCMIEATTDIFGDPCKGTPNYLEIHYYCEEKRTTFLNFQNYTLPVEDFFDVVSEESQFSTQTSTSGNEITLAKFNTTSKTDNDYKSTFTQTPNHSMSTSIINSLTTENNTLIKKCPLIYFRDIVWPRSDIGITIQQQCPPKSLGFATWYCDPNGKWDPTQPDLSECYHRWANDLESDYEAGRTMALETAHQLSLQTQNVGGNQVLGGDIRRIVNLINRLALDPTPLTLTYNREMAKYLLNTTSNMLSVNMSDVWQDIPLPQRGKIVTHFLKGIDRIQQNVILPNFNVTNGITSTNKPLLPNLNLDNSLKPLYTFTSDNIDMKVISIHSNQSNIINTSFSQENYSVGLRSKGNDVFSIAIIQNIKDIFSANTTLNENSLIAQTYLQVKKNASQINQTNNSHTPLLISNIISVNHLQQNFKNTNYLNNSNLTLIKNEKEALVFLTFPISVPPLIYAEAGIKSSFRCVFLDDDSSGELKWMDDGCWVMEQTSTDITCACSHLTNFAILLDVVGIDIPIRHEIALLIITRVGCGVSIICLILCILTFQYFKYLFNDRINIHKHLCICLLAAELLFIFGIQASHIKYGCRIIAVLLHYFFLTSFMWMLIEGIQLYTMLVEVFESVVAKIKYYTIGAYGIPFIIVGISFIMYRSGYGTAKYCWLTVEKFFIFSFVGPVSVILAANVTFLIIALYILAKHFSRMPTHSEKNKFTKIKAWIKGALILIFLMGLTWFCGLFFISRETIFAAYMFTILNSLQGLFIFVFHCILNEKVLVEYRKILGKTVFKSIFLKSSSTFNSNNASGGANGALNLNSSISHKNSYYSDSNNNYNNNNNKINNNNYNNNNINLNSNSPPQNNVDFNNNNNNYNNKNQSIPTLVKRNSSAVDDNAKLITKNRGSLAKLKKQNYLIGKEISAKFNKTMISKLIRMDYAISARKDSLSRQNSANRSSKVPLSASFLCLGPSQPIEDDINIAIPNIPENNYKNNDNNNVVNSRNSTLVKNLCPDRYLLQHFCDNLDFVDHNNNNKLLVMSHEYVNGNHKTGLQTFEKFTRNKTGTEHPYDFPARQIATYGLNLNEIQHYKDIFLKPEQYHNDINDNGIYEDLGGIYNHAVSRDLPVTNLDDTSDDENNGAFNDDKQNIEKYHQQFDQSALDSLAKLNGKDTILNNYKTCLIDQRNSYLHGSNNNSSSPKMFHPKASKNCSNKPLLVMSPPGPRLLDEARDSNTLDHNNNFDFHYLNTDRLVARRSHRDASLKKRLSTNTDQQPAKFISEGNIAHSDRDGLIYYANNNKNIKINGIDGGNLRKNYSVF